MKVIYKTAMLDRIAAAVTSAAFDLRTIDYIELTGDEWDQLERELRNTGCAATHVMGVRVEKADDRR